MHLENHDLKSIYKVVESCGLRWIPNRCNGLQRCSCLSCVNICETGSEDRP